jgi:hypothetical protein
VAGCADDLSISSSLNSPGIYFAAFAALRLLPKQSTAMTRKVLIALSAALFLIIGIPATYLALAWRDTNPLEMQLGNITFQPDGSGVLPLTVMNRSWFPVQFESAVLWHPTDHERKPMLSFNMESLPFTRHSLRPGQTLILSGISREVPEHLLEVDSFECTYVWIPAGKSLIKEALDSILVPVGFVRFRDKADGEIWLEKPSFVKR